MENIYSIYFLLNGKIIFIVHKLRFLSLVCWHTLAGDSSPYSQYHTLLISPLTGNGWSKNRTQLTFSTIVQLHFQQQNDTRTYNRTNTGFPNCFLTLNLLSQRSAHTSALYNTSKPPLKCVPKQEQNEKKHEEVEKMFNRQA